MRRLLILLCLLGTCAIPVSAQVSAVPSDRLAWDVRQDPTGLTFQIVIDGQRSNLSGFSCGALDNGVSVCSAPLPAMTPGVHTIQIVGVLSVAGTSLESAPSAPLSVSFIAVVTPENVRLIKG